MLSQKGNHIQHPLNGYTTRYTDNLGCILVNERKPFLSLEKIQTIPDISITSLSQRWSRASWDSRTNPTKRHTHKLKLYFNQLEYNLHHRLACILAGMIVLIMKKWWICLANFQAHRITPKIGFPACKLAAFSTQPLRFSHVFSLEDTVPLINESRWS